MDKFLDYLITNPQTKIAIPYILWGLVGLIGLLITIIIIGFLQGRSFKLWPPSMGKKPGAKQSDKHGKKDKDSYDEDEEDSSFNLPKTEDEFEDILNNVWDKAVNAEAGRFWNILTLLRDIYIFDNSALLKLSSLRESPYEIWKTEDSKNTRLFKDIQKSIEIAMNVISDVTRGYDTSSHRRGSIALKNKDGYLYIIMRDHHSQADEKKERFLIGESSNECGVAGYVAFTKKSLRVSNVLDNPRFINFHTTPKYKSLLCVPIVVDEIVLGTFSIDSTSEDAYTQEEEELASIFAYSIATSLITLFIRHNKQH